MIKVKVSEDNFIYDVHSLVKAFFPIEDVKVFCRDEEKACETVNLAIEIDYLPDTVGMKLMELKNADLCLDVYGQENNNTDYVVIYEGYSAKAEYNDRKEYKNVLKRHIYSVLSEYTGKKLPWGTLTGIRPTKIAMSMINDGFSDKEILDYYRNVYLTSDKKANLAIRIAHRELNVLSGIHYEQGYSLYIGIPFCPTTCLYCSFTSFPRIAYEKKIQDYIDCLKKEIDYVADAFRDKVLDSVYIGGGTPTTLTASELEELISYLKSKLDFENVLEFTVEAGRADSITRDKLEKLHELGVTRISVNPQTFKQETLDIIGRRHTVEQVEEAYALARECGFDNINMDLIVGLPGEEYEDVYSTMQKVSKLAPDSVTVHSLAIKRASRLNGWITEHGMECISNSDEIMDMTTDITGHMGLEPYYLYRQKNMTGNMENVGYALLGKEGIYNILIMEEVQTIVALGAGTVTKRVYSDGRIERCDNVKDVGLYIEKIDEMIERKQLLFD